jgi:2-oxoglutarate dehydrogenase E2 component (dihydrolipoamide succinyltransferase)
LFLFGFFKNRRLFNFTVFELQKLNPINMSTFEILMPKMGESVEEATITKWFVNVGDKVEEDDPVLEIATDKVDSEIPSPVSGTVKEIKFKIDDVVAVGMPVAVIALDEEEDEERGEERGNQKEETQVETSSSEKSESFEKESAKTGDQQESDRFYSPLVRSIAREEGISFKELDSISGNGLDGRVTKDDLLSYLESRKTGKTDEAIQQKERKSASAKEPAALAVKTIQSPKVIAGESDEVVEMDRLRKLIADNMAMSKQVSPHVTSVVEADVTNLVIWRNKVKDKFQEKHGEKLTFMPMFAEAVAKALGEFPGVNASVDGYNIIFRKNVNIGIAVALPSGNLIVPVVKQADQKNIVGLASEMNRLANAARQNKLTSDDIQGGTFTITNFGSFKNIIGTPIINQPQVAILATGTIEKKPAVIETPTGDVIAIRHKMFLSLSYDHRIVDGALGGMFLRKVADYLEEADIDREI